MNPGCWRDPDLIIHRWLASTNGRRSNPPALVPWVGSHAKRANHPKSTTVQAQEEIELLKASFLNFLRAEAAAMEAAQKAIELEVRATCCCRRVRAALYN